jgi:hypothetical protein
VEAIEPDAQAHQPGGHRIDAVAGLAPGDLLEFPVVEILECLPVARAGHPIPEQRGHARGAAVEHGVVDGLVDG